MRSGYHRIELNKTVWEVPENYINLSPVGSGAYGQVRLFQFCLQDHKLIGFTFSFLIQVCFRIIPILELTYPFLIQVLVYS